MPSIQCTNCGAILKTANPIAPGKKVKCPKCEKPFVVKAEDEEEKEEEDTGAEDEGGAEEEEAPKSKKPAKATKGADEESEEDEEENDEAPKKKGKPGLALTSSWRLDGDAWGAPFVSSSRLSIGVVQRNVAVLSERWARQERQAEDNGACAPGPRGEHVSARYSSLASNSRASGAFVPPGKRVRY